MVSGRRGFTFVELLIAATMLSVLFVGVGTHLRGGVTVWRRATGTGEALQRQRVAMDHLERDLANAIIYDASVEGVLSPQFTATGDWRWVTVRPSTPTRQGEVEVVTYRCGAMDGEPGFWRIAQPVGEALTGGEVTPAQLVPSCAALSFRYAYQPEDVGVPVTWGDTWDGQQALPRLIEASVQFEPGRAMRRVAWIPSGVFGQAGVPE